MCVFGNSYYVTFAVGGNDVYALSLYLSLHEAKDGWKNLSAKIGAWSLVLQEKKCNFATIILLNSNSYTSQIKTIL